MSRRRTQKKRIVMPDPVYDSRLVELLVRQLMRQGKKSLAYRIMYSSMNELAKTQQDPLIVIEQAIRNATPLLEVKARRIGGSTYQVPLEVAPERGTALAIRWILIACRSRSGKTMSNRLTSELLEASKNTGSAIRKRDEVHKMAEANRAFAKYRF
uniref:Small ribosomal subunit protein uS7c n=1 Tax=Parachlorella kessleri TaxID=3074 RepID=C7BEW8_PARKE|nr:ribosomal protein S7 [Parachlorella kessleri]ACQ90975.1 ribosomal protein S7 [Parachlorella kessleri]